MEEKKYRTEVMEEDSLDQAARKPGTWHVATRSIRPTLVNPLVRYFFLFEIPGLAGWFLKVVLAKPYRASKFL